MAALLVLCGVGGYKAGSSLSVHFRSNVVLETTAARDQSGLFGSQAPPGSSTSPDEIAALAMAATTRDLVKSAAGVALGPNDITAEAGKGTVVTVVVTAGDPALAVRSADAVAAAVVNQRRDGRAAQLRRLASSLRDRAGALDGDVMKVEGEVATIRGKIAAARPPGSVPGPAELASIATMEEQARSIELRRDQMLSTQQQFRFRADELELETVRDDIGVAIITPASPAEDATFPKPWHLTVLGPLVGLLLVMGIVYVRLSVRSARAERRWPAVPPAQATQEGGDAA